jgi:hypothetical protein
MSDQAQWPVPESKAQLLKKLPTLARHALQTLRARATALTARLDRDTLIQAGTLAASALAVAWSIYAELRPDDPAAPLALPNPSPTPPTRITRGLITEYVHAHSRTIHRVGPGYEETIVELTVEALRFVSIQVEEIPSPRTSPSTSASPSSLPRLSLPHDPT